MLEIAFIYSNAVVESGIYLKKCVGFIGGITVQTACPGKSDSSQRNVYSRHKRMHCLHSQTATTPDGLIFYLYGPVEERQTGAHLYRKSGVDAALRSNLTVGNEQY